MSLLPNFTLTSCTRPGLRVVRYQPLPRYPAVERDFSFVFDDSVSFEKIERSVTGLGLTELRSFVPVEIFRGGNVPAGKYSCCCAPGFSRPSARCGKMKWHSGRHRSSKRSRAWAES